MLRSRSRPNEFMRSGSQGHSFPVLVGAVSCALSGWWMLQHHRSAAVRAWSPGAGDRLRAGPLHVRVFGTGEPVLLLLHGLVTAGDCFGADYDSLGKQCRVVVPDLLGFGESMEVVGANDAAANIAALDAALAALGLDQQTTVVFGHSMGGSLAIRWAGTHPHRVRAVVAAGGPLYLGRAEAEQRVGAMGRAGALLAGDGPLPRALCAWMCRHRSAASWLAVGLRPDLPVPVARAGVKHTWATYTGALDGLICNDAWTSALEVLDRHDIPVVLIDGARDPVPVPGRADLLAARWPRLRHEIHPQGDHMLPLNDPTWCRQLIGRVLAETLDGRPSSSEPR